MRSFIQWLQELFLGPAPVPVKVRQDRRQRYNRNKNRYMRDIT